MNAKKKSQLRKIVENVVGPLTEWEVRKRSIQMRAGRVVTLRDIILLSGVLGTDAINFDFGNSGEPGYSELGAPGRPGYVEVMFPIVGFVDAEGRSA
jgi:hypothetical protein